MIDPSRRRSPDDPVVELLVSWRKNPTAEASIALCERMRLLDVGSDEIAYVATTIERLHPRSVKVLMALGRLQLASGLVAAAQRTFVLVSHAERHAGRALRPSALAAPADGATRAKRTPDLLLAVLGKLDDDSAIEAVAANSYALPPPLAPPRARPASHVRITAQSLPDAAAHGRRSKA
ncbi:MAG: hypothetical protein NVS3B10_02230 [Polyangiales bacterium]